MRHFQDFIDSVNQSKICYDIVSGDKDRFNSVYENNIFTPEQWEIINKLIVKTNMAILREYHNWLAEQTKQQN